MSQGVLAARAAHEAARAARAGGSGGASCSVCTPVQLTHACAADTGTCAVLVGQGGRCVPATLALVCPARLPSLRSWLPPVCSLSSAAGAAAAAEGPLGQPCSLENATPNSRPPRCISDADQGDDDDDNSESEEELDLDWEKGFGGRKRRPKAGGGRRGTKIVPPSQTPPSPPALGGGSLEGWLSGSGSESELGLVAGEVGVKRRQARPSILKSSKLVHGAVNRIQGSKTQG